MIINIGEWIVNIKTLTNFRYYFKAIPAAGVKANSQHGYLYNCNSLEEAEKRVREIFEVKNVDLA